MNSFYTINKIERDCREKAGNHEKDLRELSRIRVAGKYDCLHFFLPLHSMRGSSVQVLWPTYLTTATFPAPLPQSTLQWGQQGIVAYVYQAATPK